MILRSPAACADYEGVHGVPWKRQQIQDADDGNGERRRKINKYTQNVWQQTRLSGMNSTPFSRSKKSKGKKKIANRQVTERRWSLDEITAKGHGDAHYNEETARTRGGMHALNFQDHGELSHSSVFSFIHIDSSKQEKIEPKGPKKMHAIIERSSTSLSPPAETRLDEGF